MSERPVFKAPWEAQAFAMAVSLHERGVFSWKEWAEALAAVIAEAGASGDGEDYYRHWMTALERIVAAKGVISSEALALRRAEWEEAAQHTPHGQPIELGRK